jgi:hypothetical protein
MTSIVSPQIRVSIKGQQRDTIRTVGIQPNQLVNSLRGLDDVNATSLDQNDTIVYDSQTDSFIVQRLPVINGGTF